VIDNGSEDWLQKSLVGTTDIYVKLDKNYGLEYAKHLGMQFVTSRYFISTDNDILIYKYENPDWLGRLVNLMDTNAVYGALACRPQILVGTGNLFAGKEDQEIVEFWRCPGYMRIMRTDWVKGVGGWKDERPLRGHEEYWIGEQFAKQGYKMGWANHVQCWHLFGKEDTDAWGYPKEMTSQEHGHNPVYPMPQNDRDEIMKGVGLAL
jgi:GT2 family glycosyltransferase